MEEKLIYVSFDSLEYKTNKKELLQCKISLINIQKQLSHLLAVRQHKRRLMNQVLKYVNSLNYTSEKLDNNLPDTNLPRKLKQQLVKKTERVVKITKHLEKPKLEFNLGNLDAELLEIQRKLRELNS